MLTITTFYPSTRLRLPALLAPTCSLHLPCLPNTRAQNHASARVQETISKLPFVVCENKIYWAHRCLLPDRPTRLILIFFNLATTSLAAISRFPTPEIGHRLSATLPPTPHRPLPGAAQVSIRPFWFRASSRFRSSANHTANHRAIGGCCGGLRHQARPSLYNSSPIHNVNPKALFQFP